MSGFVFFRKPLQHYLLIDLCASAYKSPSLKQKCGSDYWNSTLNKSGGKPWEAQFNVKQIYCTFNTMSLNFNEDISHDLENYLKCFGYGW